MEPRRHPKGAQGSRREELQRRSESLQERIPETPKESKRCTRGPPTNTEFHVGQNVILVRKGRFVGRPFPGKSHVGNSASARERPAPPGNRAVCPLKEIKKGSNCQALETLHMLLWALALYTFSVSFLGIVFHVFPWFTYNTYTGPWPGLPVLISQYPWCMLRFCLCVVLCMLIWL